MEKETTIINKSISIFESESFNLAVVGVFSALIVLVGFLLAAIPNFELFSLMIFFSGFFFGKRNGLLISAISSTIFAFLNPMGASHIFLYLTQMTLYCFLSLIGSLASNFLEKKDYYKPEDDLYIFKILFLFGSVGFLWTLFANISFTLGMYVPSVGIGNDTIILIILAGIPFTIMHVVSNTLLFVFVLPALIQISVKTIKT